jgi:hypothetical protein
MTRKLTRAEIEEAFERADASLRLEGLTPSAHGEELKTRLLNGEITTAEAKAENLAYYRAKASESNREPCGEKETQKGISLEEWRKKALAGLNDKTLPLPKVW